MSHAEWARAFGVRRSGINEASYKKSLQHDPCAYCGEPYRPGAWREIDHIQAHARGGANTWSNYTSACGMCNVCKYDNSVLDWLMDLQTIRDEAYAAVRASRPDGEMVVRELKAHWRGDPDV